MTRESLKSYYMQISNAPEPSNRWLPEIICEQIDIIFDDLESRTCSNCKYCKEVFSYTYPLCVEQEEEPFQIHNQHKTKCDKWSAK